MNLPSRTHLSDIRGVARLLVDATTGVTQAVEKMHRTIQLRPGPLGSRPADRPGGITGFVYRRILGTTDLVGKAVETGLAPITALMPPGESTPGRDAFVSALNGVYGDHLERTGNPLAIEMGLHYRGRPVSPENVSVCAEDRDAASAGRILVLVHGLCMNDRHWNRNGHDHGKALADELGYVPIYVRYNSGLDIKSNGQALAHLLERLVANWSGPVGELVIVGFSMGGLVARGACEHGRDAGHNWPGALARLMFLGTPHHGSPLERGGRWIDFMTELSPYSAPLARLGKARSAGINDLCHGGITADARHPRPPAGVKWYAAAGALEPDHTTLRGRLVGDGLVTVDSALGQHRDPQRSLAIPENRQWIGREIAHLDLLGDPGVCRQLNAWMRESD